MPSGTVDRQRNHAWDFFGQGLNNKETEIRLLPRLVAAVAIVRQTLIPDARCINQTQYESRHEVMSAIRDSVKLAKVNAESNIAILYCAPDVITKTTIALNVLNTQNSKRSFLSTNVKINAGRKIGHVFSYNQIIIMIGS